MTTTDFVTMPPGPGHIAIKGLGALGNGALHPFVTPAHVLVIVALGLHFGQRIPFRLKKPMAALATGSAAGLLTTFSSWPASVPPALLLGCALAIAGWTTLERTAPVPALAAAAALAGFLTGLDSAPEAAEPMAVSQSLIGTWLGVNAAVGYLALCVSYSEGRPWARIAIRVAASWIIAIALLVLAFSLRQRVAGGPQPGNSPCFPGPGMSSQSSMQLCLQVAAPPGHERKI